MSRFAVAVGFFVAVFLMGSVVAQSPTPGSEFPTMRPLPAANGTGLSNSRVMDRPEMRATRVDIEPGGVRVVHTHDDVRFHIIVPITGPLQVNLGDSSSVSLVPWQPHFMTRGTPHGFQNNTRSKVSVLEVFVKQ